MSLLTIKNIFLSLLKTLLSIEKYLTFYRLQVCIILFKVGTVKSLVIRMNKQI